MVHHYMGLQRDLLHFEGSQDEEGGGGAVVATVEFWRGRRERGTAQSLIAFTQLGRTVYCLVRIGLELVQQAYRIVCQIRLIQKYLMGFISPVWNRICNICVSSEIFTNLIPLNSEPAAGPHPGESFPAPHKPRSTPLSSELCWWLSTVMPAWSSPTWSTSLRLQNNPELAVWS